MDLKILNSKRSNNSTTTTTMNLLINNNIDNDDDLIMGDSDVDYIRSIRREIRSKKKIMIIMRGLPGSGKSTLALKLKLNGVVLSTDNFFLNNKGAYIFDKRKLDEAHASNKSKTKEALEKGISPIIIDNTNLKLWEFKPYIKMACEHDYDVKLVEPNTKWKLKVGELVKKNVHNVPYEKIKSMSFDFEQNLDVDKIVKEFRREQPSPVPVVAPQNHRPKPTGLLFGSNENLQSFLQMTGNDWCNIPTPPVPTTSTTTLIPSTSPVTVVKMLDKEIQTSSEHSFSDVFLKTKSRDIQLSGFGGGKCSSISINNQKVLKYDRSCDTIDLNESFLMDFDIEQNINTLRDLFGPNRYEKSFYIDLLMKYDNDVNFVANLISETIDLNDVIQVTKLKSPLKLSELCTQILNSMNTVLERHFSVQKEVKDELDDDEEEECCSITSDSSDESSKKSELDDDIQQEKNFCFKLDKNFARLLFDQFSDPNEVFDETGSFDVDCDLTFAFEIYKNWKKTRLKSKSKVNGTSTSNKNKNKKKLVDYADDEEEEENIEVINKKIRQIESDAQLALEIFEHENMCHPIDGYPIYMSDCGVNAASISLRQIMAEQKAESNLLNKKLKEKSPSRSNINNFADNPTLAVRLKRRQIHELYSNKIETKHLDEIFTRNGYNVNETTKFIEKKLNIKPNTIVETKSVMVKKKLPTKSPPSPPGLPKPTCKTHDDAFEYRELAHEYFQIRQEYFEKATEAYSRGWGAVAQFYAEMGQKQGIYMKKSNETASVNIFALNNADLNSSNTLDLHGLHVSEAVRIFKQIYKKKQEEYRTSTTNNKKQKYLYILTGWGRHSLHRNARLRPQIMKYLNQKSIKYQEPNIGLFRVELG